MNVLRRAFRQVQRSADGVNIACQCPVCIAKDDSRAIRKKLKLAVRLDDGRYHCWVCGTHGKNITSLIAKHSTHDVVNAAREAFSYSGRIIDMGVTEINPTLSLPADFCMLVDVLNDRHVNVQNAVRYVRSRGLTDADLWRYRIGLSFEPEFHNRIVIPSFDAIGDVNFYVSRSTRARAWSKYRNANVKKQTIVFNELDVDWTRELTLTEGPFDMFRHEGNVTCLLGNSMDTSFLLFKRIVENATPVVLALDASEQKNTDKIAALLYGYSIPVRVMSIAGWKDMGQMPKHVVVDRMMTAEPWSPMGSLKRRVNNIGTLSRVTG